MNYRVLLLEYVLNVLTTQGNVYICGELDRAASELARQHPGSWADFVKHSKRLKEEIQAKIKPYATYDYWYTRNHKREGAWEFDPRQLRIDFVKELIAKT